MNYDIIQNIFKKYGTDKARHRNYASIYSKLFSVYTPKTILELGVWKGESLYAWRELFPNSLITGIDLFPPEYYCDNSCGQGGVHLIEKSKCRSCDKLKLDSNIKFLQGDFRNISLKNKFDLIIDDAEHTLEQQLATLKFLDILNDGGFMIIEDINYNVAKDIENNIPINYNRKHYDLRNNGIGDEYLIIISKRNMDDF